MYDHDSLLKYKSWALSDSFQNQFRCLDVSIDTSRCVLDVSIFNTTNKNPGTVFLNLLKIFCIFYFNPSVKEDTNKTYLAILGSLRQN